MQCLFTAIMAVISRGYHIYTSFHCTTVMERKATRKENKEMDENKVIVSTEMKQTLVNLRNLEEILCDHVRGDEDAVCPL